MKVLSAVLVVKGISMSRPPAQSNRQGRSSFSRLLSQALGSRLAASIVQRWFGAPGEDPLLVLQRASGERPEAAETLAAFLDTNSLEPLHRYLRDSGLDDADAALVQAALANSLAQINVKRRRQPR